MNLRKPFIRPILVLALMLGLLLVPCAALAEDSGQTGETSVTFTSDGSNPIADEIAALAGAQTGEDGSGSYVTDITLSGDRKTATVTYAANEAGTVQILVYNDYEGNAEGKTLLYRSKSAAASPDGNTLVIDLAGAKLPETFVLEATYTGASGKENTTAVYTYTADFIFLENATEEDFKEGYYVAVDTRKTEQKEPLLMAAPDAKAGAKKAEKNEEENPDGYTTGFLVYNQDLILLDEGTEYTDGGTEENPVAVFSEVPKELQSMTEEELGQVKGFVLKGKTFEDDTFLLSSNITLTETGMEVAVREPESIHELYAAGKLASSYNPSEIKQAVNDDYCYGWVSYTPDADLSFSFGLFYARVAFNVGNFGNFDLTFKQGTFSGEDVSVDEKLQNHKSWAHKIDLDIPNVTFNYSGLGMSTKSSVYVAANNRVQIAGHYGTGIAISASVGTSTYFNFEKHNDGVVFETIRPWVENEQVYAYFWRDSTFNVELGVLRYKIPIIGKTITIGPILTCGQHIGSAGAATAILEKDVEPEENPRTGLVDILHDCTEPGNAGCISGETRDHVMTATTLTLDVYVYDHTWRLSENEELHDKKYFYLSLEHSTDEHEDGLWDDEPVFCPHKLYRFGVKTVENGRTPIGNALIEEDSVTQGYSIYTREPEDLYTDGENGTTEKLYLSMNAGGSTIKATDPNNVEIGTATVSRTVLAMNKTLIIDRDAAVITEVDLKSSHFPGNVPGGSLINTYAGKNVSTAQGSALFYPEVKYQKGDQTYTEDWYGIKMSVDWDGSCPDATTEVETVPGIMQATFTLDFTSSPYTDGLIRISPEVVAEILGETYANPVTVGNAEYRFAITSVTLKDGKLEGVEQQEGYDDGTRQDTVLVITADFYIQGEDDDYVLVLVDNGLPACRAHFYPRKAYGKEVTAVAIGRDLGSQRSILDLLVPTLDGTAWSPNEKEALYTEIWNYPDSETRFRYWEVEPGSGLTYPTDFHPVVTQSEELSYNAVTFAVPQDPDVKEVHLTAHYDSITVPEINEVYLAVKTPIPDELLSDASYATGSLSTDPGECHVVGTEGEAAATANLHWSVGDYENSGKIRYNTTYVVTAYVKPETVNDFYRFKYPLGTDKGTKAYVLPDGDEGKIDAATDFSLKYVPMDPQAGPEAVIDPSGFSAGEAEARIVYSFTTPKAKLLEVHDPDDLWFAEGTQPEVINTVLKRLDVGITAEDCYYTSTTAQWETVTAAQIPAAGSSFTVPGTADVPDELECPEETDLTVHVVIHIYGVDEIAPPTADPAGGTYRNDLEVKLSTVTENAEIHYYVEGYDPDDTFKVYDDENPIPLYRSAQTTKEYTIHAKTVKENEETGETAESQIATFTYRLVPADTEYQVVVRGGTVTSRYGSGSSVFIPYGIEVTLHPLENEDLKFIEWQVIKGPEDFPWEDGYDNTDKNAVFYMPREDVVIAGVYEPAEGSNARLVTRVDLTMTGAPYKREPRVGDTALPETEGQTKFLIDEPVGTAVRQIATVFDNCTLTVWERVLEDVENPDTGRTEKQWRPKVDEDHPVSYGEDYTFNATYTIKSTDEEGPEGDLVDKTPKTFGDAYRFHRGTEETDLNDYFSPTPEIYVGLDPEPVSEYFVSEDLNRLVVFYTYSFPADTYTLKYDPNGGTLGSVPPQVIQLKNVKTPLTAEEPTHPGGAVFLGWSKDPEAEEPEYVYDEDENKNPTFMEDTTLYAVWSKYAVHVQWLDNDNSAETRKSFSFTLGGNTVAVNPEEAEDSDGVGRQDFIVQAKPGAEGVTVANAENGLLRFGEEDGVENIYRVTVLQGDASTQIILTSVREFHAEKEWDIDFEKKDRPDSVSVILQGSKKQEKEGGILDAILAYVRSGEGEDFDKVVEELEKATGYSLKGLSAEAIGGKLTHLIAENKFTADDVKESLKSLIKAETIDSEDKNYYGYQVIKLSANGDWKGTFEPVDRFSGKSETGEDGKITVEWDKEQIKYRVVEKGGKAPVEDDGDVTFKVPSYTNLAGKEIDEHKTVYQVSYEEKGDTTTVTNLAVEDHYLNKEWVLFGTAEKPEEILALLLWRYDEDYLNAAEGLIDIDVPQLWLPETSPLDGDKISVGDLLKYLNVPLADILDLILGKVDIPVAACLLSEDNDWHAHFRIKKYGVSGVPLEHEAAEVCSAICQDVLEYFLGVDIPVGINPLQGFVSVSVPEFTMPLTADKMDYMVNTWGGWDDDDDHHIAGSKVWVDNNNEDKLRPDSITLHVYEDGKKQIAEITVTGDAKKNYWSWTYEDDAISTKKHSYTVKEDDVEGYTASYSGLNVTNTHKTKTEKYVNLVVTKAWDEEETVSHEPLTLTVTRNGETFRTVTLSEENEWKEEIKQCQKTDGKGNAYRFGVEEKEIPEGYAVSYDIRQSGDIWNLRVTNTKKVTPPEKITLSGKKIWDDGNDKDKIRPPEVTVRLLADGEETAVFVLNAGNGWHWNGTFNQNGADGKEIVYTVTEDPVPGYTTTYDGLDVTNKHTPEPVPEKMSILIRKTWKDTDGEHPEVPVTVQLLYGGEPAGDAVTLSAENGWEVLLTGFDTEGEDTYSVTETPVPEGFAASYTYSYNKTKRLLTATVTNVPVGEDEVEIGGVKTWDDGDDYLKRRPRSVQYEIAAVAKDGEEQIVDRKVLNASTGWAWSGVYPKTDGEGNPLTYAVHELPVPGYEAVYSKDGLSVTNVLEGSSLTLTNTVYNGDKQKAFPLSIGLRDDGGEPFGGSLLAVINGVPGILNFTEGSAVIALGDGDSATVYGIPDGWEYTVREEENEGYTTWVIDKENQVNAKPVLMAAKKAAAPRAEAESYPEWTRVVKAELRNSLAAFYNDMGMEITVNKVWEDEEDPTARPGSITVNLLADGTLLTSATVTADGDGRWTHTFEDLPSVTKEGKAITYTVTEDPVSGYRTTISGFTIYNTLKTNTFTFRKVWKDGNPEGLVPVFVLYHEDGTLCRGADEQPRESRTEPGKYIYDLGRDDAVHYVVEEPMEDYAVSYSNRSSHAGVTDRCYSGGTVTNAPTDIPLTGDSATPYLYAAIALLSVMGLAVLALRRRRSK